MPGSSWEMSCRKLLCRRPPNGNQARAMDVEGGAGGLNGNRVVVQINNHVGATGKATIKELSKVFQLQYNRYSPSLKMLTKTMCRDLLSGRKRMLLLPDVQFVDQAERFRELSVVSLLEHAHRELPQVLDYLPDNPEPDRICRKYLMNIMNTLDPGLISRLRTAAINRAKNQGNQGPEEIELSQEFQGIMNNPLFPLVGNRRLLNGFRRDQ